MKRFLLVAAALLSMTAAVFTGCDNISDSPLTMDEIINQGSDNEVDLTGISCTEDITVTRAVTIKNGDFGGKTLTVNVSGVTLENAKNVNIIVAEAVGDGDFTVSGSDVSSLKVLGGGANSIHVKDATISVIYIAKANVRVALEGNSNITKLQLKKGVTAKIEITSSEVKIEAAEVVTEEGSKVEGESVYIIVADDVTFTVPSGATTTDTTKKEEVKQEETKKTETKQEETTDNSSIPSGYYKVTYDSTNLKCWYFIPQTFTDITVNSGDNIKEGTTLKFELKSNTNKVIDKWFVNDKETAFNILNLSYAREYHYTLSSSNITGNEVNVTYTLRDITYIAINFDSSKMSVRQDSITLTSGDRVLECKEITITPTLESNKGVDKWIFNETEYTVAPGSENPKEKTLSLSSEFGDSISIDFTTRDLLQYTLTFGENIKCTPLYDKNTEINSGATVYEYEEYRFYVNSVEKTVVKWTKNGDEMSYWAGKVECFISHIGSDSGSNGVISIDATLKDAETYTIEFGEEISCTFTSTGESVTSGSTVYEGREYELSCANSGKTVTKWKINGIEQIGSIGYFFPHQTFTASPSIASEGKIKIEVEVVVN